MCKFYTTTYYQKNMGFLFSHDLTYNTCTFDTWCIFFLNTSFLYSHDLTYNTCTFDTWCIFLDQDIYLAQLKNIQPGKIVHVVLVLTEEICPIFLQILLYSIKKTRHSSVFLFRKICRSTSRQCGM